MGVLRARCSRGVRRRPDCGPGGAATHRAALSARGAHAAVRPFRGETARAARGSAPRLASGRRARSAPRNAATSRPLPMRQAQRRCVHTRACSAAPARGTKRPCAGGPRAHDHGAARPRRCACFTAAAFAPSRRETSQLSFNIPIAYDPQPAEHAHTHAATPSRNETLPWMRCETFPTRDGPHSAPRARQRGPPPPQPAPAGRPPRLPGIAVSRGDPISQLSASSRGPVRWHFGHDEPPRGPAIAPSTRHVMASP